MLTDQEEREKHSKEMREKAQGRHQFKHQDRVVYEWDQTLEEINIYIAPPDFMLKKNREQVMAQLGPGQKMPSFDIKIKPKHLTIGILGNPPFIDENLGGIIEADESFWMMEDDELHI